MALKKIKVGNTIYDIGGTDEGKVNLTTPFTSNGEVVIAEDTTGVKGSGVQVSDLATKSDLDDLTTTSEVNTAISNSLTGAVSTIKTSNLTANRVLISDSSGKVAASSSVTTTELGYLDGVTSSIQTQLNNKQATLTAGDNITISSNTVSAPNLLKFGTDESLSQVVAVEGAQYGFALNSNGYYQSGNKGVHSSYALCEVKIDVQVEQDIVIDCINYAEGNYDYGLLSNLDTTLTKSSTADSSNVFKSFKGAQSANVVAVTYPDVGVGPHSIYIKFIKDSSDNANNDTLQFKVRPLKTTKVITDGTNSVELGSGNGVEIIDISGLDTIPESYQDLDKLKTCYLLDSNLIYHLSWINNEEAYFECTDKLYYHYLLVDSNFEIERNPDEVGNKAIATQDYVNNVTNTLAREVSTKQTQLTAGRNIVIEENGTIGIANPNNCKVVSELPELTPELANEETIYSYEGKLYNIIYDTTVVEHDDLRLINSYQALPYKLNGMSAAAVGDNIYILGGYSPDVGTSSKPIYQFNTITKSITEVPGSPWIYTEDNPLLVVGRTLYWRAYNISRTDGMYSFNLDTNEYQYFEFDDIYLTYYGGINTATVLGTDIYYITIDGEVQKFDTVNHTFSQYDQLDTDVDMGGCAVITYGNDIYIFGSIESDAIIKYTPATKTKRTLSATIPGGYYVDAAITIWKDKILLIGGHDDGYENGEKFFFDNIYCFDPQTETLTELDIKLGHKYTKDLMAVTVNNTIYVIGGCNYDISTNLILEYSNFTTEPTNMRYQQLTYGDASFNPYFEDKGLVLDELADEEMSGGMWVYTPVRGE